MNIRRGQGDRVSDAWKGEETNIYRHVAFFITIAGIDSVYFTQLCSSLGVRLLSIQSNLFLNCDFWHVRHYIPLRTLECKSIHSIPEFPELGIIMGFYLYQERYIGCKLYHTSNYPDLKGVDKNDKNSLRDEKIWLHKIFKPTY